VQVGERDNGYQREETSYHNWVMANERMAAVLKAKGISTIMCSAKMQGTGTERSWDRLCLRRWNGFGGDIRFGNGLDRFDSFFSHIVLVNATPVDFRCFSRSACW
jgi:hypothetical protein